MEFSRSNIPAVSEGKRITGEIDPHTASPPAEKSGKNSFPVETEPEIKDDQLPISFDPHKPDFPIVNSQILKLIKELIQELIILNTHNGTYTRIKYDTVLKKNKDAEDRTVSVSHPQDRPAYIEECKRSVNVNLRTENSLDSADIPQDVMRRSFRNPNFYSRIFTTPPTGETVRPQNTRLNLTLESDQNDVRHDEE